jgi:hypothetical protein
MAYLGTTKIDTITNITTYIEHGINISPSFLKPIDNNIKFNINPPTNTPINIEVKALDIKISLRSSGVIFPTHF